MIYLHYFHLSIKQKSLKKYLPSKHPNTNFSLEKERDGGLSFLHANIFGEKGKFVTYDCMFLSYHVRVSEWIHTL